ncbi:MAG: heme/hemin ABC transporter substrate-binding protein [Comamonas sp.]
MAHRTLSRRAWLAAGLASLPAFAQAQAQTPDAGAKALLQPLVGNDLPAASRRLVSLGGALTELVYALGAEALLVGTDTTSNYPAAANRTPKVGYVRQLAAEGVLSLRPDTVIGTTEAGPPVVLSQIRQAGVAVSLVQADHSWDEVLRKIRLVGQATGRVAEAEKLRQTLQAQWDATQASVARAAQAGRRPRALFILSHSGSPTVTGSGTAAAALLRMAGADNVMQGFAGYRPLTAESMAQAAPQVIVTTTQGIEAMGGVERFWQRPELALTPAFARKSLVAMEASHLLGFGPRLSQAVQALHEQLLALPVATA